MGVVQWHRTTTVRWRKRSAPRRRPASSADPIAVVLAEAAASGPLARRLEDLHPVLAELPDWVEVCDDDEVEGFDTRVDLADEIHLYCDPAEDGLDVALAEQRGISAVLAEDREVLYLATRLHLADVAAAVIRAVVEVNRQPRPVPAPPGEVTDEQAEQIAEAVAPQLIAAGFTQRAARRYFHRSCGDGVVQVLFVNRGLGSRSDGTTLHDTVLLYYGVCLPEAQYDPMPTDPARVPPAAATLSQQQNLPPDSTAVADALRSAALPWLEGTAGRAALSAWARADPERIRVPMRRPLLARLCAEWGYPEAARAILQHIERHSPSMLDDSDARAARAMLAGH